MLANPWKLERRSGRRLRRNLKFFKVLVRETEESWNTAASTLPPTANDTGWRMLALLKDIIVFLEMDEDARLRTETIRESIRELLDMLGTIPWHDEPPPRAVLNNLGQVVGWIPFRREVDH